MREFLSQYVMAEPGDIVDKQSGQAIGRHDGAIFYTLGQRHGLAIGGGLPYYVVGKDMKQNRVYVSRNLQDETMWRESVELQNIHWINESVDDETQVMVRIRHRAPLVPAKLRGATLVFADAQRALTPGQSAVLYVGNECIGGGIII